MKINSIETFGTHEGPGIRFVVFVQGCNLNCIYCHNPETIPFGSNKNYNTKILIEMALRQKSYFGKKGGVTVSGGEPLLQAKAIREFFIELKKEKIHTTIDTNASIINDDVKELLEYTDLFLVDIKAANPKKHKEITGIEGNSMKFIDFLEENKKKYWVRYVLIPEMTDDPDEIDRIAIYLSKMKYLERLEILPYHCLAKEKYEKLKLTYRNDLRSPTKEELESVKSCFSRHLKQVFIR